MSDPATYLWLDLETTGLDPVRCEILEVAVLATDERLVQVGAACSWVVWYGSPPAMDDYVRAMHTKNGLIAELPQAMLQPPAIEECVLAFVASVFPEGAKPVLAGSTIHFDQRFIKKHMPALARRLHYRLFDASTLKMACKTLYGFDPPKAEAHRALADVRESLDLARACYAMMARAIDPPGLLR